ncbi:MAG TPA: beta-ketoacyl synthase N-terminal-like domain-containing protein, partial [Candidatus Limnocylindrales bacterium]|nr:beta-ketoacyl synthase N-terminal-like domain-containing protein [Candidatus Limnocylindrales bacterium]
MSGAALMITRCATVLPPEPRWARDGTRTSPPGWFDYKTELGPRGYKYLPPALHYLLTAARHALADGVGAAGVVLGTNSAVSALHAAMDRTVVQSHSAELSPMLAPYFSVNLAAGKLASEHRLTGFQLTLTSPRIAGLEAIQVAARALAMGRASCLLIAATEAAPDPAEPGADRGEEGAVVLVARPLSNVDASGAGVRSTAGSAGSSAALSGGGTCRARTFFVPPDAPHRAGEALAAAWAGLGLWDGGSAGGTSKWLRDGGSAG